MFKQTQNVLIALMMSVLLMSSNVLAFHKDGKSDSKETDWTGDQNEKRIYEKRRTDYVVTKNLSQPSRHF